MVYPFAVRGPALIHFSGGRSSGYLLHRVIHAYGGALPDDVRVAFANTGKEMPQTLDFVRDCGARWGVDITWLEYVDHAEPDQRWRTVTYTSASRDGQPFDALIKRVGMLPNPSARLCTMHLKVLAAKRYAESLGWDGWVNVLGLRADEPSRVAKIRSRDPDCSLPLVAAGITKAGVHRYWQHNNFDLHLPTNNGATAYGNCDLCFLKGAATISAIMREKPELAAWWIKAEATPLASKPEGARFRSDRPSYANLFEAVQNQSAFDFGADDELNDCICGE